MKCHCCYCKQLISKWGTPWSPINKVGSLLILGILQPLEFIRTLRFTNFGNQGVKDNENDVGRASILGLWQILY